ncbi:transposase [Acidiferrobacter thiooxydans]|nr:transposase [Acidiferrobacter thiooxydans]
MPEVAPAFADLVRAWEDWTPWIFGYFDHPVTDAYTESLNSLMRVMNRLGRGYSFEALRAKILFAEGVHKRKNSRPKFERKEHRAAPNMKGFEMGREIPAGARGFMSGNELPSAQKRYPEPSTQPEKNDGADISTLVRLIESGEL